MGDIPQFLIDASGIFKLLLVLTTALFAIAQYYENRQRESIEREQERIRKLDFTLANTNEGMKEVKKKWDTIQNIDPINNQSIIFPLLFLIVFYILLFVLALLSDWINLLFNKDTKNLTTDITNFISILLKISALVLLVFSIWLLINWNRMKEQLKKFKTEAETIYTLYEAVNKAINNPLK